MTTKPIPVDTSKASPTSTTTSPHATSASPPAAVSKDLSFRVREKGLDSPRNGAIGGRALSRSGAGSGSGPAFIIGGGVSPRGAKKPALKPEVDPKKRFMGIWEAEEVDGLEAYMAELGLSKSFKRLSDRFAGSAHVELRIDQEGDLFSIQDSTEMRETLSVFVVGTPYESESEKGEEVVVTTLWEGQVLVATSTPKTEVNNVVVVRRWIEGDKLVQTHNVLGKDKAMARREFTRVG